MSYENFLDSVSQQVQNKLDALSGNVAATGQIFWNNVNAALKGSQDSVTDGMDALESEDPDASTTLNYEFDFFIALYEDSASNGDDDEQTRWQRFASKAKAVFDSILDILDSWLSANAKRAILLAKELLDLLT